MCPVRVTRLKCPADRCEGPSPRQAPDSSPAPVFSYHYQGPNNPAPKAQFGPSGRRCAGHVTYVAGNRDLAALTDWRPRTTRLEIEFVAIGAGPNGGRHRDSEDQNRSREQTPTAEFRIASFPHRCVPCAWRAAGGPHDCSYGPSPPQAPESSPARCSEIPGQRLAARTAWIGD